MWFLPLGKHVTAGPVQHQFCDVWTGVQRRSRGSGDLADVGDVLGEDPLGLGEDVGRVAVVGERGLEVEVADDAADADRVTEVGGDPGLDARALALGGLAQEVLLLWEIRGSRSCPRPRRPDSMSGLSGGLLLTVATTSDQPRRSRWKESHRQGPPLGERRGLRPGPGLLTQLVLQPGPRFRPREPRRRGLRPEAWLPR